ncbi:MAG: anaerobic ribonucleoside-triphosphate reductase [Bacilli bacterium]|jgi:ribonucleoside-triphosphate reductase
MNKIICHDCKQELEKDQEYIPYKVGNDSYAKCRHCYELDTILRNFQPVECYSRVVGYIRPVAQWNNGKKAEFSDRKVYKIPVKDNN